MGVFFCGGKYSSLGFAVLGLALACQKIKPVISPALFFS
jgi:hypothetical protein